MKMLLQVKTQLVEGGNVGANILLEDSVETQEVLTQTQIVVNLPLIDSSNSECEAQTPTYRPGGSSG